MNFVYVFHFTSAKLFTDRQLCNVFLRRGEKKHLKCHEKCSERFGVGAERNLLYFACFLSWDRTQSRPSLLDKCTAFSALSTSCWPESFQLFFFPEEWEVSIYSKMIQHWCNILTGNMVQVSGGSFEIQLWLFPNCSPAEVGLRLNLGTRVLTWFGELNRGHLWRCLISDAVIPLQAVLQWQQHKIYLHHHKALFKMSV